LVFHNNDRPGVMLASAVRTYLNRFAVSIGRSALVSTNNDSAYETALDLVANGASATVIDQRVSVDPALLDSAQRSGVRVLTEATIADVKGGRAVRGALVTGIRGGRAQHLDCDLICVSGGWS